MSDNTHDKAMAEIQAGKPELKHAESNDRSAPKVESDVHVKKVDRSGFLNEVEKGADLKHADSNDRSAPKVEADAELNVKSNVRGQLLAEIKKTDA